MARFLSACILMAPMLAALQWQTIAGSRRSSLWEETNYFTQSMLQQDGLNAGLYYDGDVMAFGEGAYSQEYFDIQAGHLTHSQGSGFILANGGWLPQFASLATQRPVGSALDIHDGEFLSAGAAYYEKSAGERLAMVEAGTQLPGTWLFRLGYRQNSDVNPSYFMRTHLTLWRNLHTGLTVLKNHDWQAEVYWNTYSARLSALVFRNHNPNVFQSGIYRRYSEAAFLMFNHENLSLRHLESSAERKTLGQIRLSNAGLFHFEKNKSISLSGAYYENPTEGFHLLLHGYLSHIDSSWQVAVGCNYGKLAKIAWVTGLAERYHPVDPVFWPTFSDISNMREDNLLYFRGRLQALEATVETRGFSFYSLLFWNKDRSSVQKLEALFRVGFSYIFDPS